jgi:asparagine synthase (glutamine-hydrolysing)
LYEEEGDNFFSKLNGLFSGILIDQRKRKSFVFNDRFGMHRLFIHSGKDGFFFSSEAKALLSVLPETREFDPKGVVELITCGCTLSDRSLYKHIEVLPGGSLFEFENGRLVGKSLYFDRMTWETQSRITEAEFFAHFIDKIENVAQKYALSCMPVALSLTGGFDCRMLIACLNPAQDTLPCYTFGSMYRETYDVKVARRVAETCKQQHHVLVVGEDFLKNLPVYLEKAVFLSDGYLGLSGAAELYVNTIARLIAPVRVTGNWGSELLRGIRAFKFVAPSEGFLNPALYEYVDEVKNTFFEMSKMKSVSFSSFLQAPYQSYGRYAIERSKLIPRTPFLDNEIVRLVYQAPETVDGLLLSQSVIRHFRPDLIKIPTDRGYLGDGGSFLKFMRRGLHEVIFKSEYFTNNGFPNSVRLAMELVPQNIYEYLFLGRNKFYHFRKWLRQAWASEYLKEKILSKKNNLSHLVLEKSIDQLIAGYQKSREFNINKIDKVLTLSLAAEIFT